MTRPPSAGLEDPGTPPDEGRPADQARFGMPTAAATVLPWTWMITLLLGSTAAWAFTATVGEQPTAAAAWLCLPIAVCGAWSATWARLAAVCALLLAVGSWLLLPGAGVGPGLLALHALLFLVLFGATGQLVGLLTDRVRDADREIFDELEAERLRALDAVAERDTLSSRLRHQAMHDTLTELPNRTAFLERLVEVVASSPDGQPIGVLFIDLDDFKIVNDSLGHAAGDELLIGVASRLRNALRGDDLVARFGGDEFAVLLGTCASQDQALGVAARLIGVLRAPFALSAGMASGQASGGLVHEARPAGTSAEDHAADLLRKADLAMYAAKGGGGRCVPFEEHMQESMLERLALQDEIRHALIHDEFYVEYQPVVDLATQRLVAVEALARWRHPERGQIPPSVFIPVAEESGAIVDLGMWVLEQACLDLKLWDDLCPGNDVSIAVNVSARQLREAAVAPRVARVLHRAGVEPRRVVLEVTESLLMDDGQAAAATLWQLRGLGMRIAVDDFGTGYSSLSRLVDLPLDDLKIDRGFVAELERSDAGATIVRAAVAMAHGLNLSVVAEGVENETQLDFLRAVGCDLGQGYLFSPPVAMDAVTGMLRRGSLRPRARVPGPRPASVLQRGRPTSTALPPSPRHR